MSFARVCVCMPASPPAAVIVLHMLLAYSFHLYFISFHFIPFYARLFLLFAAVVVVAVSGWCYELFYIHFKYAAYVFSGRRFEYLHAIAMSILRHFHCDSVCLCVSVCVCVCVRATNYFRPTADGVASFECEQISNAVAVSSVATPHNNRQKFAATVMAKNRQSHLLVPKNTLNTEFN